MAPQAMLQRYVFLHWTFVFRFIAYGSSSNATTIPEMVTLMRNIFESLPEGQMYKITQREFDGRYFQVKKKDIYFFEEGTKYISSSAVKKSAFSRVRFDFFHFLLLIALVLPWM